jgi:hypothetical protein
VVGDGEEMDHLVALEDVVYADVSAEETEGLCLYGVPGERHGTVTCIGEEYSRSSLSIL